MKNSFIDLLYYIFIYNLKILKPFFHLPIIYKKITKKQLQIL